MSNIQFTEKYRSSIFSFVSRYAGIVIIIILAYLYWNAKAELQQQITLQEAATAEMIVWKDKDGLNNAHIDALEAQTTKAFLQFVSRDSSIVALQNEVKAMSKYLKKQGSVTNFSTATDVTAAGETQVIVTTDSLFPTYKSQFQQMDKAGKVWAEGTVIASKDSTSVSQKVYNEYTLVIGREPQGFLGLGKSKAFAEIKNLNPFSETTALRTYQVALPREKRFVIGPSAGATFDGTVKPYIGVGVTYGLIRF